jgi:hypothetical protein
VATTGSAARSQPSLQWCRAARVRSRGPAPSAAAQVRRACAAEGQYRPQPPKSGARAQPRASTVRSRVGSGPASTGTAHTQVAFISSTGTQSQFYVLSPTSPGSQPRLLGSFNGDLGGGYGLIDWLP